MNGITNGIEFLSNGVSPVFTIISLVLGFVILVVGLVLKSRSKEKNTAGWICIGIGVLSIISNVIQLIIKFAR